MQSEMNQKNILQIGITKIEVDSILQTLFLGSDQVTKILSNQKWQLNYQIVEKGKTMLFGSPGIIYHQLKLKTIFPKIISSSVKDIHLDGTKDYSIIKQISHINFERLKRLYLNSNNIDNVEVLDRINLNNLSQLNLSRNLIINTKTFHKLYLSNIKYFSLAYNPIKIIQSFAKTYMNVNRSLKDSFCFQFPNQNYITIQDLSQLLKLSSQEIHLVYIKVQNQHIPNCSRIVQDKIVSMNLKKYQSMSIRSNIH